MVIQENKSFSTTKQSDLHCVNNASGKNHVCELLEQDIVENIIMASPDIEKGIIKKKSAKKSKNNLNPSNLEASQDCVVTQIDENDLDELRTVYQKCKAVMKKIESKYGHLLDLEEPQDMRSKKRSSVSEEHICTCPVNKKIVFDEDGKEITLETDLEKHICVKKLKRTRSTDHVNVKQVQVEYESTDLTLPDDLQSLVNILHDTDIEITHRNKVIKKIKMLKQGYIDEIRFNKHVLIEKLKSDPDEILDFQGTNLKSLPGYLVS